MDAPTTTAKRKRSASASLPAAAEEVSDAEVEEFYAILRRMRDASRRLCTGAGSQPPQRAPVWRPSFSWEDFATPAPAPAPEPAPAPTPQSDERVAENATPPRPGLDLNAEPEPETEPPAAPAPASSAPCSARAGA